MILENNYNYNVLGKMGSVYPRPEYVPHGTTENKKEDTNSEKGIHNHILSRKDNSSNSSSVSSNSQESRINLQAARSLTVETATGIMSLSPEGINVGPHKFSPTIGLLNPQYI